VAERTLSTRPVFRWNEDKKHRCPHCYAVAVDMEQPRSTRVYTCCMCGTRFTRWPLLAPLLRDVGVRCSTYGQRDHP
jgi:DNA-directed RNA polymerase subunit RPC12/RpoP